MTGTGYDPTQLAEQWKRRTQREELCLILTANPRPMSGMSDGIVEMDVPQLGQGGSRQTESRNGSVRSASGLGKPGSSVGGSSNGGSARKAAIKDLKTRLQTEQQMRAEAEAEVVRLRSLLAEREQ